MKQKRDKRRGIQSVDASAAILNVFTESDGPKSLSAVAKGAGFPSSTAHRYLVSLQRSGFVFQNPVTGFYDLGPAALRMGLAAMRRLDAIGFAEDAARATTAETGETSFVSVWSERGPTIIRWFPGDNPIITTAGIGAVLPIVGSSTGRLFAAHLERPATRKFITRELQLRLYGVSNQMALEKLLKNARNDGFSAIDGLIVTGLRAVAAPILDLQGHIQATVTLLSVNSSLIELPNKTVSRFLANTRKASSRLGFDRRPSSIGIGTGSRTARDKDRC